MSRGQWGLLATAILFMLFGVGDDRRCSPCCSTGSSNIFSCATALDMLVPLSLAALGVLWARAAGLFLGRATVDSLGEKTVARRKATCSKA